MWEEEEEEIVEEQPDKATETRTKQTWDTSQFSTSSNELLAQIQRLSAGADLLKMMDLLYVIHKDYSTLMGSVVAGSDPAPHYFLELINYLKRNLTLLSLRQYNSQAWAQKVLSITDIPEKPPVIVGRMLLIAAILEHYSTIRQQLNEDPEWTTRCIALIDKLDSELQKLDQIYFDSYLTEKGRQYYDLIFNQSPENDFPKVDHDTLVNTLNLSDAPANIDSLSRRVLANHLAKRIRYIYDRDIIKGKYGAFFVHIDGAWGSGKSTLMNFLKDSLQNKVLPESTKSQSTDTGDKWIIVNFNAWEHQRLTPPWWYLMKGVYQEALKNLKDFGDYSKRRKLWFREHLWRINTGTNYLLAAIVMLILFIGSLFFGITSKDDFLKFPLVGTVTFILFLWSLTKFLRTSLVSGTSQAAMNYIKDNGRDPLNTLAQHFSRQIEDMGYPVAVLIDDLDRCNKDYGILLLEGLQTIFKKAPVVYVVAADSKWLSTMYENHYNMFEEVIAKPAKPFGLIFLDKIFQIRIELPEISGSQKKLYWSSLLEKSPSEAKEMAGKEKEIMQQVQNARTLEAKLQVVNNEADNLVLQQKAREAVVDSINVIEENRTIEHKLVQFVELIEPNPRSMKRLINDIGMAKAMSILYDQHVDQEQLILWTILKQRYPELAEFFWNNPDEMDQVLKGKATNPEFDGLLKNQEVKKIFEYALEDKLVKIDTCFLKKMKFIE